MKTKKYWLKLPIWIVEIFTEAKSFEKNPILGNRFLNLIGLHVLRVLFAHGLTGWRRFLLGLRVPREYRSAFKKTGYIQIDNVLSDELFNNLHEEASKPWPQTRYFVQGDTTTEFLYLNEYSRKQLPSCEKLSKENSLNRLMNYVAASGLMPWMNLLRIQNISGNKDGDPQKIFHSDTFHPTMKAWLFLEDVTIDKGPFEYISGSNKLTWARLKWEYQNSVNASSLDHSYARRGSLRVDEAQAIGLGYGEIKSFNVAKNTLVIADTFGFHRRGVAAKNSSRLSMAFSLRLNPFLLLPIPNLRVINRFVEKIVNRHYQSTTLIKEDEHGKAVD